MTNRRTRANEELYVTSSLLETFPSTIFTYSIENFNPGTTPWLIPLVSGDDFAIKKPPEHQEAFIEQKIVRTETNFESIPISDTRTEEEFCDSLNGGHRDKMYSIPIYDSEKLPKPLFHELKLPCFLVIDGIEMNRATGGIGGDICLDMYTFDEQPYSETGSLFIIKGIQWYQYGDKKINRLCLPIPPSEEAALYVILYRLESGLKMPFYTGSVNIYRDGYVDNQLEIPLRMCNGSATMFTDTTSRVIDTITVNVSMQKGPLEGSTVRYIAQNPHLPTSICSFNSITCEIAKKGIQKGIKTICEFEVEVIDKQLHPGLQHSRIVQSSVRRPISENEEAKTFYFPDNLSIDMSDTLLVEYVRLIVYIKDIESKPYKTIFKGSVPLTKMQEHYTIQLGPDKFKSQGNSTISFNVFYPILIAPTPLIRESLNNYKTPPDHRALHVKVVGSLISRQLQNIEHTSLAILSGYTNESNKEFIDTFIDAHLTLPFESVYRFMEKLMKEEDLKNPDLLFRLLFKMVSSESMNPSFNPGELFEAVQRFILEMANRVTSIDMLNVGISRFLLMMQYILPTNHYHRMVAQYLRAIPLLSQIESLSVLLSSMDFIQNLKTYRQVEWVRNFQYQLSVYSPIISTIINAIHRAFAENEKQSIKSSVTVLRILVNTLECYGGKDVTKIASIIFFPLLISVIQYSSILKEHVQQSELKPFVLFILKNIPKQQFLHYFINLNDYNRLGYFEFLEKFIEPDKNAPESDSMFQEASLRFIKSLRFLHRLPQNKGKGSINGINAILEAAFRFYCRLLSERQGSRMFFEVFVGIADTIKLYAEQIFNQENAYLTLLMKHIVPITQRKMPEARVSAVGFIRWLIQQEMNIHSSGEMCLLALQTSLAETSVKFGLQNDFCSKLPCTNPYLSSLVEDLGQLSKSNKVRLRQLLKILDYSKEYPAIQALMYDHIAKVNEENRDFSSAFMSQWSLCALIAEIFRIRREIFHGIPADGWNSFPFLEKGAVNLEGLSQISMQSPYFNVEALKASFYRALELSEKSEFFWLTDSVTYMLSEMLETHREFKELSILFKKISDFFSCAAQVQSKAATLSFFLVVENDHPKYVWIKSKNQPSANNMRRVESVYPGMQQSSPGKMQRQSSETVFSVNNKPSRDKTRVAKETIGIPRETPVILSPLHVQQDDITKLYCREFTRTEYQNSTGWNEPYATVMIYKTAESLPSIKPYSEIIESKVEEIMKRTFFLLKLNRFREKLNENVQRISPLLPKKTKQIEEWRIQFASSVSYKPFLLLFRKTLLPEKAYYKLLLGVNTSRYELDTPPEIVEVCHAIWDELKNAAVFFSKLQNLLIMGMNDIKEFNCYKTVLFPEKKQTEIKIDSDWQYMGAPDA